MKKLLILTTGLLFIPFTFFAMMKAPIIKKISVTIKNNTLETIEIKSPETYRLEPRNKKTVEINYPDTDGYAPLITIQKDFSTIFLTLERHYEKYRGYLKESTLRSLTPKELPHYDSIKFKKIHDNEIKAEIIVEDDIQKSRFYFLKMKRSRAL